MIPALADRRPVALPRYHRPRAEPEIHSIAGAGVCRVCGKEGRGRRIVVDRGEPELFCRDCSWRLAGALVRMD